MRTVSKALLALTGRRFPPSLGGGGRGWLPPSPLPLPPQRGVGGEGEGWWKLVEGLVEEAGGAPEI